MIRTKLSELDFSEGSGPRNPRRTDGRSLLEQGAPS
jgi:hypothetical protein